MKQKLPALLAGLASLILVLWFVWRDTERLSPGPLSAVHDQESGLAQRCEACHGNAAAEMASACASCHAAIQQSIATKTGLHGGIAGVERCGTCHSEHHGSDFQLVTATTFARAGIADRNAFRHEGLGFRLEGKHLQLSCQRCHAQADDWLLAKGQTRFLGLSQDCQSCHNDPHRGQLPNCASCHGQSEPFAKAPLFQHTSSFPLSGAHAGLSCTQCHEAGSARAIDAYAKSPAQLNPRSCQDCHSSPHRPQFLAALALGCADCHSSEHQGFAAAQARLSTEQHAASGFALEAPHAGLACTQCHANGLEATRPARAAQACAACHQDPHAGQFGAQACADCHGGTHFAPSQFDALRHAQAGFALRASHAQLECQACHQQRGSAQIFRGTKSACADCHQDPHRGQFGARSCAQCHNEEHFTPALFQAEQHAAAGFPLVGQHAQLACAACHTVVGGAQRFVGTPQACADCHQDPHRGQFQGQACSQCHTEQSFAPSLFDAARHAQAGFALKGAHAALACDRCHSGTGSEQRFRGTPQACADCHQDPHAGAFPAQKGCVECHSEESFAHAAASFDHERWTHFALRGAHLAIPCESCHQPLSVVSAEGRRKQRAKGTNCQDCHSDPHAGQFANEQGVSACARCHQDESDFRSLQFDHQSMSRFALDATHAKLACAACHRPVATEKGTRVVRFKPLGTACGDCHDPRRER